MVDLSAAGEDLLTLFACLTLLGCAGVPPQTQASGWKELTFGDLMTLSAPDDVVRLEIQGIDSEIGEWKSDEVTIRIDYGLYSDRLTSYGDRKDHVESEKEISGLSARVVEFEETADTRFVAAHFFDLKPLGAGPKSVTVVVQAAGPSGAEAARRIIQSIEFVKKAN